MKPQAPRRKLRKPTSGDYALAELELANRNHGFALEALRYDVTPIGMHYLLTHFDVPYADAARWKVTIDGLVNSELQLSLSDLKSFEQVTERVTLECAGNGRAAREVRYQSMPWRHEAVGTSDWTGVRLRSVLAQVGLKPETHHVVFEGADRGIDGGAPHNYGRALTPAEIDDLDPLLVTHINGQPLPPQHGAPLRLIVPGWYGMASVKWLNRITAIDHAYQGHQQIGTYIYREKPEDEGVPVREIRVKSLISPPGIPTFFGRERHLEAGPVQLIGRAWSGSGTPITRVEVGIDGTWHDAELAPLAGPFAWRGWHFDWQATSGQHELTCRATDASGASQPLEPPIDVQGFGNNAVHRIAVHVS